MRWGVKFLPTGMVWIRAWLGRINASARAKIMIFSLHLFKKKFILAVIKRSQTTVTNESACMGSPGSMEISVITVIKILIFLNKIDILRVFLAYSDKNMV